MIATWTPMSRSLQSPSLTLLIINGPKKLAWIARAISVWLELQDLMTRKPSNKWENRALDRQLASRWVRLNYLKYIKRGLRPDRTLWRLPMQMLRNWKKNKCISRRNGSPLQGKGHIWLIRRLTFHFISIQLLEFHSFLKEFPIF